MHCGSALHPYPADLVIATKGGVVRTGPNLWQHAGRPAHDASRRPRGDASRVTGADASGSAHDAPP
jgi:hypothetical protein